MIGTAVFAMAFVIIIVSSIIGGLFTLIGGLIHLHRLPPKVNGFLIWLAGSAALVIAWIIFIKIVIHMPQTAPPSAESWSQFFKGTALGSLLSGMGLTGGGISLFFGGLWKKR